MECGHVGILTVDLHLPVGSSLKAKRKELLRLKSALGRRFSCAVAEVDHHDLWQRAGLTVAIVGRAAGEELTVAHRRRERRGNPFVHRVDRLDIVVAVDQDARFAWIDDPFSVDDGVAVAGDDFDRRHAGSGKPVGDPLCGAGGFVVVRLAGADAWNAQQLDELIEKGVLVVGEVRLPGCGFAVCGRHPSDLPI